MDLKGKSLTPAGALRWHPLHWTTNTLRSGNPNAMVEPEEANIEPEYRCGVLTTDCSGATKVAFPPGAGH